jgi:2'-5' RNA ligase
MGSAVSLVARNKSAHAITRLWHDVSQFETAPSMQTLNYPPHFTFAMFDGVPGSALKKQIGNAFQRTKPLRVRFDKIKYFDVDPMVLWTAPTEISRLQALHHAVHATTDAAACRSNFLPGKWAPHLTLATQIDPQNREAVLRFINQEIDQFDVVFNAIEIFEYSPIKVVKQWRLDL